MYKMLNQIMYLNKIKIEEIYKQGFKDGVNLFWSIGDGSKWQYLKEM